MRVTRLWLALFGAAALAGCEQLHSEQAEIMIETNPPGASCTLLRANQPVATIAPTPGIAVLAPDATTGLSAYCRRPGFADAAVTVPPNVIVSDWWTGSYPLPEQVQIPLAPPPPLAMMR
ncbi:MAG: hypothetical protein JO001_00955 [Alphaproteobacteria bacterium]|nr:hypothetical protein [Alphaproteobacteria bacterium]